MPDTFGALELPIPPVGASDKGVVPAVGDPALDTLAVAFSKIISSYVEDAWKAMAPGEDLFRKIFTHDPQVEDFTEKDLPALYVFAEEMTPETELVADGEQGLRSAIHLLWIEPPAHQRKRAQRAPFYRAIGKVAKRIVDAEGDPAWVSEFDSARAENDPVRVAAEHYGSNIPSLCGFDRWRYRDTRRATIQIGKGVDMKVYRGLVIRLAVTESDHRDPTGSGALPLEPFKLDFQITSDSSDEALVLQHGREPLPT